MAVNHVGLISLAGSNPVIPPRGIHVNVFKAGALVRGTSPGAEQGNARLV